MATDLPSDWKEQFLKDHADLSDLEDYLHDYLADTMVGDLTRENPIVEAEIVEVTNKVDLIPILEDKLKEAEDFKQKLQTESSERYERKQYERLKKKFEGR